MIGRVISDEFSSARDWPMAFGRGGAAGADGGPTMLYSRYQARAEGGRMTRRPVFLITVLCFGFAFFYIPILSMIVYSFNASRLATVWGGFSTKWYVSLSNNNQVIDALVLSLKIALVSATLRDDPGHDGGHRAGAVRRFRGRTLFSGW
jgi:ABC-type spermidine/putrescine transport system permease subunit I